MKRIDSRTNPIYRQVKTLLTAKGIREHGLALVSGRKLVPELLLNLKVPHTYLIVPNPEAVSELRFPSSLDVLWLAKELFEELDDSGTHFPLLVTRTPELRPATMAAEASGLEVVLSLSNPLNLGATLRSCDAFGVSQVVLLKECANPFLPKVIRSSSGSSLQVRLLSGPSIKDLVRGDSEKMWALDLNGKDISTVAVPKNLKLFIGEEGQGVPQGLLFSEKVTIPIRSGVDSLNALAATSIALFALRTKMSHGQ